ncbi:TolC family outer membrane protein [Gayadomonas joobiniege]|uniref:TolC family outer membrane protein n=1 Tax=Gayadomonas joobiniege TaxID=1234606 RepID=UPI000380ADFD|nr:TolC family outer membrane protein [Gayadomonas joobiniege]
MKSPVKSLALIVAGLCFSTQLKAADLVQVYQLAKEQDPLIKQAEAEFRAAEQLDDLSRSALLPQINGSLSYSDDNLQNQQQTAATIGLVQSIYQHDNWLNLSKADKQIAQSRYVLQLNQYDLINRVVNAYLDLLLAQDNLTFVQAEKEAIQRELERTREQLKVGIAAVTNLHEAQAQFDASVAEEISAENEIELARENLREITGQYYIEIDPLKTDDFTPPKIDPQAVTDWLKLAETSNPQIQQQKLAMQIAKTEIDIAEAGHLPNANFSANYSWADTEGQVVNSQTGAMQTLNTQRDGLAWTVSVDIPIYTGGRVTAASKQAAAQYVISAQGLQQIHRGVIKNVRSAYNNVKAANARIDALKQSVISAESALDATQAGFRVGTRTIVDVLNSTQVLYSARSSLAAARYDYIRAIVALKSASGRLTDDDILAINSLTDQ